jgi:hypothetical protein
MVSNFKGKSLLSLIVKLMLAAAVLSFANEPRNVENQMQSRTKWMKLKYQHINH